MAHDEDPGVARGRAAVRPAIRPPARRRRDTESS